jgi:hypothetical protein
MNRPVTACVELTARCPPPCVHCIEEKREHTNDKNLDPSGLCRRGEMMGAFSSSSAEAQWLGPLSEQIMIAESKTREAMQGWH